MPLVWNPKYRVFLCVGGFLSVGFPAMGEEPVQRLSQLVVQADATEDLEAERLDSPVPEVGLNREGMRKQPALHLGDSLKAIPGVYYGGNLNENKDLQLRGLTKGYSRTQVGGVQIPDGGEVREFQLNRLPSGIFKEAKFIRNPTAEFESDGIGGRLDLETVDIPDEYEGEFRLGFGARNGETPLWSTSAMAGGRPTAWFGVLGAVNYGMDPALKDKRELRYDDNGDLERKSQQDEYKDIETYGAFIDAGIFYEGGELHIKPMFLRLESSKDSQEKTVKIGEDPDEDESLDKDFEERTKQTEGFTASSLHNWSASARQETVFSFYKSYENTPRKGVDTFKEDGGVLEYDGQELEKQYKEDLTWDFQTKTIIDLNTPLKQQVKFGAGFRSKERNNDLHYQESDENGVVDDLTTPADEYHLTEDYYAAFAQDQVWLTEKFSLLPGFRTEYVELDSEDGANDKASRSMTDLNPTLHALYQQSKDLAFHLGFSRTVNRPQFDQLSPYRRINDDDEEVTIGNPDLDPARSWNIDLGADWKTGGLFAGTNLFYKKITGVIQEERIGTTPIGGDDYDLYESRNVGDGWLKGVELDQRYNLTYTNLPALRGFAVWANEAVYSSRVTYDSGGSRSFEEQPEFIANVGVDYTIEQSKTRISLSGNYVDTVEWEESDGTQMSYAPEWIVNLSIRQPITKGLEAFVEINNLLDEERIETEKNTDDEVRKEFIKDGRSLLVGLNYSF
jgi:outer membrane receptor protein involved in Fe transport